MMLFLRILAIACGAILIYASIFLYEDEEGKIQNKLEDLWLKISNARKYALSKHTAFMQMIAKLMTIGFDRIFGSRLFSLQSIGVSICYAMVFLNLTLLIISRNDTYDSLSSLLFSLILGTIPVLIRDKFWLRVWFMLFVFLSLTSFILPMLYYSIAAFYLHHTDAALILLVIIISIGLSAALFTLFIGIMRKSLNRISTSESVLKISLAALFNGIPFLILYVLFKLMLHNIASYSERRLFADFNTSLSTFLMIAVFCGWFVNGVFVMTAIIFVSLSLLMVLHRLFWPFLDRPIYSLQKLGIAKRSKLLGSMGAMLIMAALGGVTWLDKVIEKFNPF